MSGEQYRFRITKTRLYELIKRRFNIRVSVRSTRFVKYYRRSPASLDFWQDEKLHYFCLSSSAGDFILEHLTKFYNAAGESKTEREEEKIPLAELLELDLVEPMKRENYFVTR